MDQPSMCCAFLLLLASLISSPHLTNPQPIADSPIAKLSTSWINTPASPELSNGSEILSKPILINGPSFACGFFCNYTYTACLFAVVMASIDNTSFIFKPQLVWSANRNQPVKLNATLLLTDNGDLILADADGTFVWSTNTGGKSVSGLKLTEEGNLVLFDRSNLTVWQSFDYPTDSLLRGQKLVPWQKLTARISATNWSQGLYSLATIRTHLRAYIETSPPEVYFDYPLGSDSYLNNNNGSFMRLEPDGHLKVYQWGGYDWKVGVDWLTQRIGVCGYPMVCGKYSICSKGQGQGQCGCPDEAATFRPINDRQPNLGCFLETPISCNHSQYHSLLELKYTTYFSLDSQIYSNNETELDEKTELEDCKNNCLRNCTCKAALFLYSVAGLDRKRGCLSLSEVFTIMNNVGGYYNSSLFLKVQKSPPQKKSRNIKTILGSSLGAFFVIFLMVASCFIVLWRKRHSDEDDEFLQDQFPGLPTRFSYEDLKAITSNFSNKLGEGGFGSVFGGTLTDGTKVAVKHLNNSSQVKQAFLAEVETIGSIHHVNLVRLIGFCAERSYRLLVYEYMSNGSLDSWIFNRHQEPTLAWQSRRKIIVDIAKGLAYLHEECRQKIFHLDIKPQNILLDENFDAKVSDFGLAKLIDKDQSQVVTMLRGTPGYLAPEWLSSIITEKVDVYSFGVVVLEILCGRKNLDWSQPEEDMHLLSLFKRKADDGQLLDMVDKSHADMQLHGTEAVEMMRVAVWCLQNDFSRRPSMSMVVKVLEGYVDVEGNLDYSFTYPVVPRTKAVAGHREDAIADSTPLIPSTLSGPR